VIAVGFTLLLASCSARVAASLLARSVRTPPRLTYALRVAASHGTVFVLLLLLARQFSDTGNTRMAIGAYLCIGIAALGVTAWVVVRRYWTRLTPTRSRLVALMHSSSWLMSLLMLAVAAALMVPVPAAAG
jgi:hypothetical protein